MQDNLSTKQPESAMMPAEDCEAWLQPIPESQRTHKVSGQFWIWAGANLAPINWVLGALGIHLGLGFADTVTVLVLGNLIGMLLFGCFVLLGQKTGATGMVLARAAFGRRGNYLPAAIQALLVIGWCAVNTWIILDLVMALFGTLGWVDPTAHNYAWKIGVATAIMAAQVAIAWFGYKAIAAFEKWTVPPTIIILAVMSAVAWFGMKIDWGYAGPAGQILEGSERIAAMSAVMTAIGIGWGITWFTYAADYSRFVSTEVPKKKVYLASVLGQFIPVVWLGILGASLATNSGEIDPGKLIVQNFGVMALPVLLMVLHGPIATNILNIYTFSVATQSLDITISRRKLNLFVGVFSLAAVVFFIFQEDFATVLDAWLIGLGRLGCRLGRSHAGPLLLAREALSGQPGKALRRGGHQAAPRRQLGRRGLPPGGHLRHVAVYVRTGSRHAGPHCGCPGRLGPLLARRRPGERRQLRPPGPEVPPQAPGLRPAGRHRCPGHRRPALRHPAQRTGRTLTTPPHTKKRPTAAGHLPPSGASCVVRPSGDARGEHPLDVILVRVRGLRPLAGGGERGSDRGEGRGVSQ